jgi:hypothetical protein
MEARGPTGGEINALARREASFVFLAFLLASLLSLPITSAKALPTVDARLRDCRMELLVDLDFGVVVLESEGIILINEIKGRRRRRQWSRQVQWSIKHQLEIFPFRAKQPSLFTLVCTNYHIKRPTPSRGRYRKTPIVIALITPYHTPSSTTLLKWTVLTCDLNNIYGIKK